MRSKAEKEQHLVRHLWFCIASICTWGKENGFSYSSSLSSNRQESNKATKCSKSKIKFFNFVLELKTKNYHDLQHRKKERKIGSWDWKLCLKLYYPFCPLLE